MTTKNLRLRQNGDRLHGTTAVVLSYDELLELINLIEYEDATPDDEVLDRVRRKLVDGRNQIKNRVKRAH